MALAGTQVIDEKYIYPLASEGAGWNEKMDQTFLMMEMRCERKLFRLTVLLFQPVQTSNPQRD